MTTLSIGRLSATAHAGADGERVTAMLGRLADRGLDDALRAVTLPPGDWYVRRLDLTLVLDDDRAGAAVEARWAAAVLDALRRALAGRSPDVVHHPRPVDGLAELVTELAAGRTARTWAWRRAGLLQPGDPAPGSAPAEAVLAAAHRRPELVSAALVSAVGAVGVPALHRLLGASGWRRLAVLVRAAAGGPPAVPPPLARRADERAPGNPVASARTVFAATATGDADVPVADVTEPVTDERRARLVTAVTARSVLAAELRHGRIRPTAEVAVAWAVLVAGEAEPGLLARTGADDVLRHLAAVLAGTASIGQPVVLRQVKPPRAEPLSASPDVDRIEQPERPDRQVPAGPDLAIETEPPELLDQQLPRPPVHAVEPGRPEPLGQHVPAEPALTVEAEPVDAAAPAPATTGWAGLLFLLATAEEAGIPGAPLDDPALAARTLRWSMAALAPRLLAQVPPPPAADDPAVLALAGLTPTAPPPEGRPPLAAEATALDGHARRWAATTARRLGREDDDPAAVVTEVARRPGAVVAVPGWIEVHLPLDEADVDIRRAGLDLDPGWVPWLGAVVRYVYA